MSKEQIIEQLGKLREKHPDEWVSFSENFDWYSRSPEAAHKFWVSVGTWMVSKPTAEEAFAAAFAFDPTAEKLAELESKRREVAALEAELAGATKPCGVETEGE